MKELKYYVLWTKDSPLLKNYFQKYYQKLLDDLKNLQEKWILKEEIEKLLKKDCKNFILNADISSLINWIVISLNENTSPEIEIIKLKEEIEIFLEEWISSDKLSQNKWDKIYWTQIRLTDTDNNPYNWRDAHPEHKQLWAVAWNWWEKSKQEWLEVYKKTFELLKKVDRWIYDELNQIITKIIPLGTAKSIHNSASYKECVGHLYLWYTIDSNTPEINNLEAVIHESSHNKLNLLMQFDPVILNSKEEKYYSAIRPDARHIHWVFLWYHAFAPTMYIIMKAYLSWALWDDKWWFEKIILFYIKTKFLQKVIKKYALFTDLGKEINEEIDYVVSEMDILFKEMNPSNEMIKTVRERQRIHFQEVNMNYPNLEY